MTGKIFKKGKTNTFKSTARLGVKTDSVLPD